MRLQSASRQGFDFNVLKLVRTSIKAKLVFAFTLLAVIPLVTIAVFSYMSAKGELANEATTKLQAVADTKQEHIEDYFKTIEGQVRTYSQDLMIVDAAKEFTESFRQLSTDIVTAGVVQYDEARVREFYSKEFIPRLNENLDGSSATVATYWPDDAGTLAAQFLYIADNPNPVGSKFELTTSEDGTAYSRVHAKYHDAITAFQQEFNYYDVFIADPATGHIVYTVFKEIDFGTSLLTGPYANTNIADVFKRARTSSNTDDVFLQDFATYAPSFLAPASFIASPIVDPATGETVGVLIFQMPIDEIDGIMQTHSGLGESGETYIVGQDRLLRSNSRFSEETTLLDLEIDTESTVAALSGKEGTWLIDDYRGVPVLSAYAPMDINGVEWAIIAEIDDAEVSKPAQELLRTTVIITVIAALIVAAAGFLLARQIAQPISNIAENLRNLSGNVMPQMVSITSSVAQGDLTKEANFRVARIDSDAQDEVGQMAKAYNEMGEQVDSVGRSINEMTARLRELIGKVREAASELGSSSAQLSDAAEQAGQATQGIATTAQQVATGSQKQAETVQDAVGLIDSLTSEVGRVRDGSTRQTERVSAARELVQQVAKAITGVAQNAQTATDGSASANTAAENGLGVVRQTVEGISRINEAVDVVAKHVSGLGEQSAEIGKIVSVIDDIAAQTNLLALNAAIEAARAGEQGRGFAVVADEVRQLAERVSQATSEIAGLIESVQKGVEDSVRATEAGTKQVAEGTALADSAGKALEEIIRAVGEVSQQIEQISAAAEQVSSSSDEMVSYIDSVKEIAEENTQIAEGATGSTVKTKDAMENIAAITEESSAAAEESSASTEEMSAQIEELVASAQTLAEMSEDLNKVVEVFKVDESSSGVQGTGNIDVFETEADPEAA
ncbi:MAG: methyl-accepting chemotaxis protein [Chloroflexi bacterium]|nr:methyl-accepting chemotaxis protein [Chloroflexota bacterium]